MLAVFKVDIWTFQNLFCLWLNPLLVLNQHFVYWVWFQVHGIWLMQEMLSIPLPWWKFDSNRRIPFLIVKWNTFLRTLWGSFYNSFRVEWVLLSRNRISHIKERRPVSLMNVIWVHLREHWPVRCYSLVVRQVLHLRVLIIRKWTQRRLLHLPDHIELLWRIDSFAEVHWVPHVRVLTSVISRPVSWHALLDHLVLPVFFVLDQGTFWSHWVSMGLNRLWSLMNHWRGCLHWILAVLRNVGWADLAYHVHLGVISYLSELSVCVS